MVGNVAVRTVGKSRSWRRTLIMYRLIGLLLIGCLFSLIACAGGPKQRMGSLGGAVLGGVGGSFIGKGSGRTAAIIGGTLLGSIVGSQIGKSMDDTDRLMALQARNKALESKSSGKVQRWVNPDNKHKGGTTPLKTYYRKNGTPCREFQETVTIGGHKQKAYGTACRQTDGSWKITRDPA